MLKTTRTRVALRRCSSRSHPLPGQPKVFIVRHAEKQSFPRARRRDGGDRTCRPREETSGVLAAALATRHHAIYATSTSDTADRGDYRQGSGLTVISPSGDLPAAREGQGASATCSSSGIEPRGRDCAVGRAETIKVTETERNLSSDTRSQAKMLRLPYK